MKPFAGCTNSKPKWKLICAAGIEHLTWFIELHNHCHEWISAENLVLRAALVLVKDHRLMSFTTSAAEI
jgi:hypothetical protein